MTNIKSISERLAVYKPAAYFVLKLGIIYILWRLFSAFVGEQSAPAQGQPWPWLTMQWRVFNDAVRDNLIYFSDISLSFLGYITAIKGDVITANGSRGVSIGHYCLAVELWVLFIGLIAVYPGPFKHKLWLIPVGVIFIHFLNVLRTIALSLMVIHMPNYVEFNHHFTFRVIVFGFILLMYWLFIKQLSPPKRAMA